MPEQLAIEVGKQLLQRAALLACAESCTGGWIAKVVTDVAGSSAWFDRGFVTYSNASKTEMLGVPAAIIESHGAVSQQVVEAMVAGAIGRSTADTAIAVSGIAGPGGGSAEKPVGTVWIGWGVSDRIDTTELRFDGDRESVRRQTVAAALAGLLERL